MGSGHRDSSLPTEQPEVFKGFIRNTFDALLIFEAAIRGTVPRVTRRFSDIEKREGIYSGVVYVFGEEESEIKRWTGKRSFVRFCLAFLIFILDGLSWSASRINKNFLVRSFWRGSVHS